MRFPSPAGRSAPAVRHALRHEQGGTGRAGPWRVPALDVLRAVAIAAVFMQHLGDRFRPFLLGRAQAAWGPQRASWLGSILTHGHWGVDLFFVLSGFTLGLGFVRDFDAGRKSSLGPFFARRALRILPAYYGALALHLLAHTEVFSSPAIAGALLTHLTLLQGYLAPGKIVLIGASWSLSTEAHFYLLAPLLAWLMLGSPSTGCTQDARAWRVARWALFTLLVCAGVWMLRSVLYELALRPAAHAGFLELSQRRWVVTRVDQFALGLAGALAYVRAGDRLRRSRATVWLMAAVAVGALGVAAPLDSSGYGRAGGGWAYPIVSLAMAALVLAGACSRVSERSRAWAPMKWLGVVSYGVFLYHQLALEWVGRWIPGATGAPGWTSLGVTAAVGGALSVLAGWLSWTWIESPSLRKVARRVAGRSKGRGGLADVAGGAERGERLAHH